MYSAISYILFLLLQDSFSFLQSARKYFKIIQNSLFDLISAYK